MKKQLLACVIAVGLAGTASPVVAEGGVEPTAQLAYHVVKYFRGSDGAQAFGQGAGAAAGGLLGAFAGPIGVVVGAGIGSW